MQRSINTKNLFFVMVLLASLLYKTKENQHKRELYYGTQDYVCESGVPARKDIVTISLQLEDSSYNVYYADGGTVCNNLVREPWLRVRPVKNWNYYTSGKNQTDMNYFRFSQTVEYKYTKFLKRTKSIVATSVIVNPTIIKGKSYECQMQKTTLIQHFGLYGRHEPSVIFMKCQKQKQSVKQE